MHSRIRGEYVGLIQHMHWYGEWTGEAKSASHAGDSKFEIESRRRAVSALTTSRWSGSCAEGALYPCFSSLFVGVSAFVMAGYKAKS